MSALIIGSGGREHAIALKLFDEENKRKIFVAPGNAGTSKIASNVKLDISNHQEIIEFVRNNAIQLVIIGPEQPLVDGLADFLRKEDVIVFGPNKKAARIEGDKEFAKNLMQSYHVPTARFQSFQKNEVFKSYRIS